MVAADPPKSCTGQLADYEYATNHRITYSERSGSVTGHGPAPSAVERSETLLSDELEEATTLDGLGVGLHLDLEDVKGEKDDLTDTGKPAPLVIAAPISCANRPIGHYGDQDCASNYSRTGGSLHEHATGLLAEGVAEPVTSSLVDQVTEVRLATELVDTLSNLVTSSVAKSREEGHELGQNGRVGGILEDDLVEGAERDVTAVGHQTLRDGVDGVEDDKLGDTCGISINCMRVIAAALINRAGRAENVRQRAAATAAVRDGRCSFLLLAFDQSDENTYPRCRNQGYGQCRSRA